ncbi:MAG: glycosyltransferase family 4 protein [Candidatus Brocadiae bacterium]|nr:glycosyltransferase family 4 protein [Candidatus Brocadiia bacterium]
MKVLMLTMEYPEATGNMQAEYIKNLAQGLSQEDVQVYLVSLSFEEKREKWHKGVHIHRVEAMDFPSFHWVSDAVLNNMKTLEEAITIAEKEAWDLIVAYDWACALTAKSLKTIYGIPLIAHIHDLEVSKKGDSLLKEEYYIAEMQGWICQHAEKIITSSLFMQGKLSSIYNIPHQKIQVIPLGINPEQWVTHCNLKDFRHLFALAKSKIVLFSGNLTLSQGPQILLEAAKQVLQKMPDTTFLFAGRGELYQDLAQKAKQISENILFPGQLKGKALVAAYRIADCLIIPSLYEHSATIALEAMACGTPVIATDTGALSEIIDDRKSGLKIPPDDPQALALAILGLLSDFQLAQNLAERAMEQVQKKYLISYIALQTKKIYQDTLRGK